jgi:hypothetical protein
MRMDAIRQSLILVMLFAGPGAAAVTPRSAAEVMDEAKAQAAARQKTIFLIFDASW